MRKVDPARALAALQFVASESCRPKSVEEPSPKGVGFNTLCNLAEGGFLDHASETEFIISGKGLAAIRTESFDWPTKEGVDLPDDPRVVALPPTESAVRPDRQLKGGFVTQEQILAVYKAAKQAGIHVEVRIEGGVVRFIPCSAPQSEPASRASSKKFYF